jgi:hypothetical protein
VYPAPSRLSVLSSPLFLGHEFKSHRKLVFPWIKSRNRRSDIGW